VTRGRARRAWLAIGAAWLLGPTAARALEPRYDHRDQHGVQAELGLSRDSVVVDGLSHPDDRLALRLAWTLDVSGEGDELQLGGSVRLGSWSDPEDVKLLYGVDARYRAYFGAEELKTFVEVGAWVSLASRLAIGASAGLGLAYDPSRAWGVYLCGSYGGGFGTARVASLGLASGVQLRW
jgi:hypothetical protein